jgi:glycosyltransferase involved in cell wall biosynthesis
MTRTGSSYANAGFPFKLGEYLATSNPVIASNVSDINLYLVNGKDALIISPDNIDELVEAMKSLIIRPEEANEIGKNGRKKCEKYFDAEINGKKLLEFIQQLTNEKN